VANILYGIPFLVPETATYTSITIEVTTLKAGSSLRLGIYRDSSGAPGALVLDAGVVSGATTGAKTIVISQQLTAGWYWLACLANDTPTIRALTATSSLQWLGYTSGTDVTTHAGWSVAQAYGALPDPFTPGGALTTIAAHRIMLAI
jgi:hypothetical protein